MACICTVLFNICNECFPLLVVAQNVLNTENLKGKGHGMRDHSCQIALMVRWISWSLWSSIWSCVHNWAHTLNTDFYSAASMQCCMSLFLPAFKIFFRNNCFYLLPSHGMYKAFSYFWILHLCQVSSFS